MKNPLLREERAAKAAIRAGEHALRKHFDRKRAAKTSFKAHKEFVTAADVAANRAIQSVLRRLTPDIPIMSEEGPTAVFPPSSRFAWILDPLDGTTNYSIGLPIWGISLALVEHGAAVRGWISLPMLKERFVARRNAGAWWNGKPFRTRRKLHISESVGLLCHGYAEEEREREKRNAARLIRATHTVRRLGSASVELAWVATGRAGYLLIYGAKPWDLAAGSLLVKEAGGRIARPNGNDWNIGDPDMLAANPDSFPEAATLLKHA